MTWTPQTLSDALNKTSCLDVEITNNQHAVVIRMNDYGDLQLNVLLTSRQIIVETYICPVNDIKRQAEFNLFLLRNQKVLPLSSVGISRVRNEEYYVAFGALSLSAALEDIVLEITTLVENALDLAEIIDEYMHE